MKQIGKLFVRPALVLVLVMLVVVAAMPGSASAMLALGNQDFNTCLPISGWTFLNPTNNGAATGVTEGAFSGESYLKLTLPTGVYASITDGNVKAPRLVTSISDASFEIEVKYLTPVVSPDADFVIEGLLFRDTTDAAAYEWLRIDLNSRNNTVGSYISYMQTTSTGGYIDQSKIEFGGVQDLTDAPVNQPVLLRVKYDQAAGTWTVTYTVNGATTVRNISESTFGGAFTPNEMSLFIANGSSAGGHVSKVDYIHMVGTTLNDDAVKLTVNKVGSGTVTQTACTGNVVTLNAVPTAGETFIGWSGADTNNANPSTTVTMNTSKTVTATFSGASALDEKLFLPRISR